MNDLHKGSFTQHKNSFYVLIVVLVSLTLIYQTIFTTKQQGTGLGLASCKNIVEQHGGEIFARNNPTTFTIKLPK